MRNLFKSGAYLGAPLISKAGETCIEYTVNKQALKYLLQGRLTKCPMTLSLGRTYVR